MKNRLFPIIIALCFVSLIGVAFLRTPNLQNEAPIKTESVQEGITPNKVFQTENAAHSHETDATSQTSLLSIDNIDMDEYKAALRSKDIERLKKALGPELSARVDAGMKFMEEKMEGLEEGEFPDFNLQEYMEIMMGENAPKIDLAEISQKAFRRHFPEGEPEDYEPQMAARIREIAFATPGDLPEVMQAVTMNLMKEKDFQFWALAHFKGELGQQMEWMKQEILTAKELADLQHTIPENMSTFGETLTAVETQNPATSTPISQTTAPTTDSIEPPPTHPSENVRTVAEGPAIDLPAQMSEVRITSIKEILSQHGTDGGLLHLLETDMEGANWLLERFGSSAEIETWLSEQSKEAPPSKSNLRQFPKQPLPPEVQP